MSRYVRKALSINSFADLIGGDEYEINNVPLTDLHSFKNHPFKVIDDDKMDELVESIKKSGVLTPGIVRADIDGGYEIISGHRRKRACELAGLTEMPVVIKHLNDDEAVIAMVDSNSQREEILPSEKAFAYKMRYEALKRKAGRPPKDKSCQVGTDSLSGNECQVGTNFLNENECQVDTNKKDINLCQVGTGYRTDEAVAKTSLDSARTIQRYIRLTELEQPLLDMVDRKKLKFNPAVELSYLTQKQQETLIKVMDEEKAVPSLAQAQRLKRMSQEKTYTKESVRSLLSKPSIQARRVIIDESVIMRYFTPDTSDEYIQKLICSLLDEWQGRRGML